MKPTLNVKLQNTPTVKMKSKEARKKDKKSKKTKTEKAKEMELKKKKKLASVKASNKEKPLIKTINKKILASEKLIKLAMKQEKDQSPERKKIKLDSVVEGINSAVNGTRNKIKRKAPEIEIAKPSKMQVEKPIEPEFSRPTNIGKRRNSCPSKIPQKVKLTTYVKLKKLASSTSRRRSSTRQSKKPFDAFESISTINSGTNSEERSFSNRNEALDKNSKMTMPSSMENNLSCVFLQRDTFEEVINNEAKDHTDQHNFKQPARTNKKKPGPSISRKRNSSVLQSRDPSDASENISEMNIRSTVGKKSSSPSRSEVSNKKAMLTRQSSILYKPSSDLLPSDTIEQIITNISKDDIVQQSLSTEQFENIQVKESIIDLCATLRRLSNENEDLDYDFDSDQDNTEALSFSECSNNLNDDHDDENKTLKGKKNPHGIKSVKKAISDKCSKNAEAPKLSPLASENVDPIESKSKNSQLTSSMEELSEFTSPSLNKQMFPLSESTKTKLFVENSSLEDRKLKSPCRVNLVTLTQEQVDSWQSDCSPTNSYKKQKLGKPRNNFKDNSTRKFITKRSRTKFISSRNSSISSDESDEMISHKNKYDSDAESVHSEGEHYESNLRFHQTNIDDTNSEDLVNYSKVKSNKEDEMNSDEDHSESKMEYNEKHSDAESSVSDSESNNETELSDKKDDFDEDETSKNSVESYKLNLTSENFEESDNNSSDEEHSEKDMEPDDSSSNSSVSSDKSLVFQKPFTVGHRVGTLSERHSTNENMDKQLSTYKENKLICSKKSGSVDELTDENLNLKSKSILCKNKTMNIETTKNHSHLNVSDHTKQISNYKINANEKVFEMNSHRNEEPSNSFNQNIIHKDTNDVDRNIKHLDFEDTSLNNSKILFKQKFRNNKTKSINLKNNDNSDNSVISTINTNYTNDSTVNVIGGLDSDKKLSQSVTNKQIFKNHLSPLHSDSKLISQSINNFKTPNLPGKVQTKNRTSVRRMSTDLKRKSMLNSSSFNQINCIDNNLILPENSKVADKGEEMLNSLQTDINRNAQMPSTSADYDDVLSIFTTFTVKSDSDKTNLATNQLESPYKMHLEKLPEGKLDVFYGDTLLENDKQTNNLDKTSLDIHANLNNDSSTLDDENNKQISKSLTKLPDIKKQRSGSSIDSSKSRTSLRSGSYKIPEVPIQSRPERILMVDNIQYEQKDQKSSSSCGSDELKTNDRSLLVSKSNIEVIKNNSVSVKKPGNCNRCGGNHSQERCPHFHATCYNCGKKGHVYRMCPNSRDCELIFEGYCHNFLKTSTCHYQHCSYLHQVPDKNSISIRGKPPHHEIHNFLRDLSKPPPGFVTFLTKYLSSIQDDTEILHLANVLKNKLITHQKSDWYDIVIALSLCMNNNKMSAICKLLKHLVVRKPTDHQVVDKMVDMIVMQFSKIGDLWPVVTILLEIPDYTLPTILVEIFLRHILLEKKSLLFMRNLCLHFIKNNRVNFKALIKANVSLVQEFEQFILSLKLTNYASQLKALLNSCDQRRNNVVEHLRSTDRTQHEYFQSSSDPLGINFEEVSHSQNLTNKEIRKYIPTNNVPSASNCHHNVPAVAEDSFYFNEANISTQRENLRTNSQNLTNKEIRKYIPTNNVPSASNCHHNVPAVAEDSFYFNEANISTQRENLKTNSQNRHFSNHNILDLRLKLEKKKSMINSLDSHNMIENNVKKAFNNPSALPTSTKTSFLTRRNTSASYTITSEEEIDVTGGYDSIPQYTNEAISSRKTNVSTQPVFQSKICAQSPLKVNKSPSKITRTAINFADSEKPPNVTRTPISLMNCLPQTIPIQLRKLELTNRPMLGKHLNQMSFDRRVKNTSNTNDPQTQPSSSSITTPQQSLHESSRTSIDVMERLEHLRQKENQEAIKFEKEKAVLVKFFQNPNNNNWREIVSIIEDWGNHEVFSEKIKNILYIAITKDKKRMVTKLNYFAHYVSGIACTNNSSIRKTVSYLVYNIMVHAVGQDRWRDAFSLYKIIDENNLDIKTVSAYNGQGYSAARKILTCTEICLRVNEFKSAITILNEYHLLYPRREQWSVSSEEDDLYPRNQLVALLLQTVRQLSHENDMAANLFLLLVDAQENLENPINIADVYDDLQNSAFNINPCEGLKLFEHIKTKCKIIPPLNKGNYRASVVASILAYGPHTVKNLITRGTIMKVYPRQTNKQLVRMKSSWTIEEMEAVMFISLEQLSKEWSGQKTSKPSLLIHIEFESLTDNVPDFIKVDCSLQEAKKRLSVAIGDIGSTIETNIITRQRNDGNIEIDSMSLINYFKLFLQSISRSSEVLEN